MTTVGLGLGTYSAESLKIEGVKPEEGGIVSRLDHERVFEVDHVTPPGA